MATLSGEAILSCSFFASCLNKGSTHKEKKLLLKEQILSFKSRPLFRVVSAFRETYKKSQKLAPRPLHHPEEKRGGVPIHPQDWSVYAAVHTHLLLVSTVHRNSYTLIR